MAVGRRLERLDDRIDALAGSIDGLRGELVHAVSGQTRAMFLGVVTSVADVGGLSYTLATVL